MEGRQIMKTFIQKIALSYYRYIDGGYLFEIIKGLNPISRLLFYIGYSVSFYISLKFIGSFINPQNEILALLATKAGQIVLYLGTMLSTLLTTYESILQNDPKALLKELKSKEAYIKKNKLQWYRLRNMSLFTRSIIYISMYIALSYILNILSFASYVQTQTVPMEQYIKEFKTIFNYFAIGFIFSILTIEYFTRKKIKEKKEE